MSNNDESVFQARVAKAVNRTLLKWAAVVGVANILALVGVWQTVVSTAKEAAESTAEEVVKDENLLRETLIEQQREMLKEAADIGLKFAGLEAKARTLEQSASSLSQLESLAANLTESDRNRLIELVLDLKEHKNIHEVLGRIDAIQSKLTTESISIVDSEGNERIKLALNNDSEPTIRLIGATEVEQLRFGISGEDAYLAVYSDDGEVISSNSLGEQKEERNRSTFPFPDPFGNERQSLLRETPRKILPR